jgi:hypothetical protein
MYKYINLAGVRALIISTYSNLGDKKISIRPSFATRIRNFVRR